MRERIKLRQGAIDHGIDKIELIEEGIDNSYIADSGDDQITVFDGPSYDTHDHVHTLNLLPLRYPLSKRLRRRYEGNNRAMLKEEEYFEKRQEFDNSE